MEGDLFAAPLFYTYDQTTMRGLLEVSGTNIVVDQTVCRGETYRALMDFSHPNLLRTHNVDFDYGNIIYQSHEQTLDEWMNFNRRRGRLSVMPYNIPSTHTTIYYVPQEYRSIIKGMVSFIHDLHEYHYCTRGFDSSNVVLFHDKIKFWKIQFRCESESAKNEDYRYLHSMIQSILHGGHPIPNDMNNFLYVCYNYGDYGDSYRLLILNHPALMSHNMRLSFMQNLEDKKNDMGFDGQKYRFAVALMGNTQNWISLYTPSLIGPLLLAYDNNGRGRSQYIDQGCNSNASLLRLVRNQAHHLRDYSNQGRKFTEEGADVMIMHVFGDMVCYFTFALAHCGILDRFTLKSN